MKKALILFAVLALIGCRAADRAAYNLSREADSFNVPRRVTVFNIRANAILFQMDGYFSMKVTSDNRELQLTGSNGDGTFFKHFIYLADEVSYVVQQLSAYPVSDRHYRFYINPDMVLPEIYMFDE